MSLVWMFFWQWYMIFYMKDEFLFDDFEWFFGGFTLYDSCEYFFYVLLGFFIPNEFFIIVLYRKYGIVWTMVGWCLFFSFPFPSMLFCFRFGQREMFNGNCLIISEWTYLCWEKFPPFMSHNHMINNFSTKYFVFVHWVGFIHDAVMRFFEWRATKEIMSSIWAKVTIKYVRISWVYVGWKGNIISINGCAFVVPGTERSNNIIWIIGLPRTKSYIFTVHESFGRKTFVGIFTSMEKISGTWFAVDIICIPIDSIFHKSFDSISYRCLDFFRWFPVLLHSLFIYIFWKWFVEKIIWFITQICTTEAIMTTAAIKTK